MLFSLLIACRGPEPAPTRFESLLGWMFTHADDEDESALADGVGNAEDWLDTHFDQTLEGYEVDPLTEDQLAAVGVTGQDLSGLRGVAVGYPFAEDVDTVTRAMMSWRDNDLNSTDGDDATLISGDTECFADGTCDAVSLDVHLMSELGFNITLETWMRWEYRRVPVDDQDVVMMRVWSTQPPEISTDLFAIEQVYQIWVLYPSGDVSRSIQGEWVDAEVLSDDLDLELVMKLWVNGLIGNEGDLDVAAQAVE